MKSCPICGMPIRTECARKACTKVREQRAKEQKGLEDFLNFSAKDQEKNPPKVRGEHVYEPVVPFSEYVPK